MEFYNSYAMRYLKTSVNIITEENSSGERDHYVSRSTLSGQITLLTKTLGRGIDFICLDEIVSANGGVHVIQTFLSEELSEEIQIKGRTARQGDHGSYSMVLRDSDLEKYLITTEDIIKVKNNRAKLPRFMTLLGLN